MYVCMYVCMCVCVCAPFIYVSLTALAFLSIGRFSMCTNYNDIRHNNREVHHKTVDPSAAMNDSAIDEIQWVRLLDFHSVSPRQVDFCCCCCCCCCCCFIVCPAVWCHKEVINLSSSIFCYLMSHTVYAVWINSSLFAVSSLENSFVWNSVMLLLLP